MKYFNPNYWFKLWVLSAPLFNDKTQGINAMSIDNKKIKDWASNNTNLQSINQEISYTNSSTNYQPYNLNQVSNQSINPFYQTELETNTHKHRHEKSRNRRKRYQRDQNVISYQYSLFSLSHYYVSFTPEFWEKVNILYYKTVSDSNSDYLLFLFGQKFYNELFLVYKNTFDIDSRVDQENRGEYLNDIKNIAKGFSKKFKTINDIWSNSDRRHRVRIVLTEYKLYVSSNIRQDEENYDNKYIDNLERDFPVWNKNIIINLGIINNNFNDAFKQYYPNFILNNIEVDKLTEFSNFCKCNLAKLKISGSDKYSNGILKPEFSYVTQSKLNEISNIIANDEDIKKWIKDINDWNSTLPQTIENAKTFTPQALYNWKRQEKETIKNYLARWNTNIRIINNELKIDELNKNIQGLKSSFDSIKNQINELDRRVQNLENVSDWNCANIISFGGGAISLVPVVGSVGSAVATMTSSACAIAGV